MKYRMIVLCLMSAAIVPAEDRLLSALRDKQLAEQASRLKTDDRISFYAALTGAKPENLQYRVLLASSYIQKMRETTDFSYIDRANEVLKSVLDVDGGYYDALRLRTEIELERHNFKNVVELSKHLAGVSPRDPWNWATMGDAYIELGDYDNAAEAYQKMISLRPDLASYNRAAHYRFLFNDVEGAIKTMQMAIEAGSRSAENVAWCQVELGNYYAKTKQPLLARRAYESALRSFANYHPALAALGRLQASLGEREAAIANLKKAQSITPLPDYAAALYDLYTSLGKHDEAAQQKQLIEMIDKVGRATGEKANRNLALIFADHDWHLDRALELARNELEYRKDVYTYDALAWALYKNGQHAEAARTIELALKLKTPEPSFAEHAEKIRAAAAGEGTK